MKSIKLAVLSTLLAAAGGAAAGAATDREALLRQSSEMNLPLGIMSMERQAMTATPAPLTEADRRAEEFRMSVEMMKPPTPGRDAPAGAVGNASGTSEADRKVAEAMRRTERMKPN